MGSGGGKAAAEISSTEFRSENVGLEVEGEVRIALIDEVKVGVIGHDWSAVYPTKTRDTEALSAVQYIRYNNVVV